MGKKKKKQQILDQVTRCEQEVDRLVETLDLGGDAVDDETREFMKNLCYEYCLFLVALRPSSPDQARLSLPEYCMESGEV